MISSRETNQTRYVSETPPNLGISVFSTVSLSNCVHIDHKIPTWGGGSGVWPEKFAETWYKYVLLLAYDTSWWLVVLRSDMWRGREF